MGITLLRLALGVFVAGTAGLMLLGYWEYQRLIDYCAGSPEVRAGGDRLSCLEPYNRFAEGVLALGALLVEVGLIAFVVVAFMHDRKARPSELRPS